MAHGSRLLGVAALAVSLSAVFGDQTEAIQATPITLVKPVSQAEDPYYKVTDWACGPRGKMRDSLGNPIVGCQPDSSAFSF
jgi:hypothetical protein